MLQMLFDAGLFGVRKDLIEIVEQFCFTANAYQFVQCLGSFPGRCKGSIVSRFSEFEMVVAALDFAIDSPCPGR